MHGRILKIPLLWQQLDAWQNPEDPAVMATACDNAQAIIEEAIANE